MTALAIGAGSGRAITLRMAAMIFKVPPQWGHRCIWFDDYVEAVEWAQDYALANRRMSKSYSTCGVGACTLARRRGTQTQIGGQRPRFPTMRFTGLGSTAVAPLLQLLDFTNNE